MIHSLDGCKVLNRGGIKMEKEKKIEMPWWNKYCLSIEEAATYYNIDLVYLKQLIEENPHAGFINRQGSHRKIIKEKFERWYYKKQGMLPWWEKYSLSIKETAIYYNIGENKLRYLLNNNPDLPFIVHVGQRITINRKKFEEWYDHISDI